MATPTSLSLKPPSRTWDQSRLGQGTHCPVVTHPDFRLPGLVGQITGGAVDVGVTVVAVQSVSLGVLEEKRNSRHKYKRVFYSFA